uniref:protein-tyrosine-phosphatase n=1 Tax=Fundulus heteroclitus TaxID=8078 RepID=A0A3Q2ST24_FUNHE
KTVFFFLSLPHGNEYNLLITHTADLAPYNIPLAGALVANKQKNRYPYILPYDHCRVRLSVQNQNPNSDYINASFGGGSERDFICTQGPLPNTVADFWRMVWEQNVRVIVMVTALRQKSTIMCDKYWSVEEGTVRETCPSFSLLNFVLTYLYLRDFPNDRIITHYYYPSWPDQGVPNPVSLCAFAEHVRQHLEALPRLGPAVVHCSAGVGRSGTFVTVVWLMQLSVRGIPPDIKAAVKDLRLHRMWTVQTLVGQHRLVICSNAKNNDLSCPLETLKGTNGSNSDAAEQNPQEMWGGLHDSLC